jgi:hypothetical protein
MGRPSARRLHRRCAHRPGRDMTLPISRHLQRIDRMTVYPAATSARTQGPRSVSILTSTEPGPWSSPKKAPRPPSTVTMIVPRRFATP